jgi:hypothetical protein
VLDEFHSTAFAPAEPFARKLAAQLGDKLMILELLEEVAGEEHERNPNDEIPKRNPNDEIRVRPVMGLGQELNSGSGIRHSLDIWVIRHSSFISGLMV